MINYGSHFNIIFILVNVVGLAILLAFIVLLLAYSLALKPFLDREKLSPFECGFLPQDSRRAPFSMHFFLIALVFLIFDVELILLFPFFFANFKG